ncbi:2',5'-phosphodiesterase 12-like [Saccostrea echinata]|uniref:2',5'-phosphodiesterase 12-like n=1 Tax=Saccostrea echinata TaxID=191078 RepID=UPI002A836770|nr:2',5'-phosphodiesterase 12-like [Saccostrea echinata]
MLRLFREKLQINIGYFLTRLRDRKMEPTSLFIVRSLPDNDRITMEFDYSHDGGKPKQFRMDRIKEEELGQTFARLKNSITSKFIKRKRKKNEPEIVQEDTPLKFTINGVEINTESKLRVAEALIQGSEVCINEQKYQVSVNPPTVLKLELPKSMMSGFPVFPKVDLQFANVLDSEFTWNRVHKDFNNLNNSLKNLNQKFLSKEKFYTPTNDDIDHKIELSCIPKLGDRSGSMSTIVSKVVVEAGPGVCPFEMRHMYTSELTDSTSFRVVSYNILADAFADTDFTRNELYPYCPPYAQSIDYRKQLLLKEILGYNADIICLQEVDEKVFDRYLLPALQINGFSGVYQMKSGKIREGEALFYRNSKFRATEEHTIDITQSLEEEAFKDIKEKLAKYEVLYEFYKKRKNVLQVHVLESVSDPRKKLCVANTHLFFHRDFDHIRIVQGVVSIRHLEQVMTKYREQGDDISLVFCGDFNASPQSPLHGFLITSQLKPEEYDLQIKDSGEKVTNFDFSHSFKLTSACGYPRYTNYVGAFHGQLDYVFVDSNLEVVSVVPPPDHEQVTQHLALPSIVFPSDHIAQICVIKWK